MEMYEVRSDKKKNRIYITIGKVEDESEMVAIVDAVKRECKRLKPGFTCLTDLRRYYLQDEKYEKYIKQAQKILVEAGLFKVVRVRRELGGLAHFQFDNASYEIGYHAESVTDLEEAEKMLDEEVAKNPPA